MNKLLIFILIILCFFLIFFIVGVVLILQALEEVKNIQGISIETEIRSLESAFKLFIGIVFIVIGSLFLVVLLDVVLHGYKYEVI